MYLLLQTTNKEIIEKILDMQLVSQWLAAQKRRLNF
jgi:hypothetical protein